VGAIVIASFAEPSGPPAAFAPGASAPKKGGHYVRETERQTIELAAIESWVTAAAEAHLGQKAPDDPEEAFDRIASLHRLLHDGVEGGNEREVLTAFAEALFAWDGIEAIGYVEDVQGHWRRAMTPPATGLPLTLDPALGRLLHGKQAARLGADDLLQLGFTPDRHVVAVPMNEATPEPWLLLFAEGYRTLNLPRLNLYADLLREALARLSSIVETRAAWAILQT